MKALLSLSTILLTSAFGADAGGLNSDELLARALQAIEREDQNRSNAESSDSDSSNDAAIAAALAEMGPFGASINEERHLFQNQEFYSFSKLNENQWKVINDIETEYGQRARSFDDQDVHRANRELFVPIYNRLKPILETVIPLQKEAPLTFDAFQRLFQDFQKDQHFSQSMNKIQGYWENSDNETNQTTQVLAGYAYYLCTKESGLSESRIGVLYRSISDNAATGGGCHPGVNGRMISVIISWILNEKESFLKSQAYGSYYKI